MKAMIFAAGLGTRLYPITQSTPKALIKVKNIPLIEIVIRRLMMFGYNEIIINIHHHADQIEQFVQSKNDFGIRIAFSDERDKLLDTGGGLKKASWFFDDGKPFLVHNVDVISDIDLGQLMERHIASKALATLAVKTRPSSRYLLFNQPKLSLWVGKHKDRRKNHSRSHQPRFNLLLLVVFRLLVRKFSNILNRRENFPSLMFI